MFKNVLVAAKTVALSVEGVAIVTAKMTVQLPVVVVEATSAAVSDVTCKVMNAWDASWNKRVKKANEQRKELKKGNEEVSKEEFFEES